MTVDLPALHFMDPAHAAYAMSELMKPKLVIPMHYGTFDLLKGTPEEFNTALSYYQQRLLRKDRKVKTRVMTPGESISL